jgi:chemotaxis protein MotB
MKRFGGSFVKVGLIALTATILSGCVSQGKYDELKFAQRNCEAERERLTAELAGAQNTIRMQDQEIKRLKELLANREDLIRELKNRFNLTDEALRKMTKVYEDLAKQRIPTGQVLSSPISEAVSSAIEDLARKYPNLFEYDAARGVLKFKSDLLFDSGSAVVKETVVAPLKEFAKIMDMPEAAKYDVVIVGHTDSARISVPATRLLHPTNWHLSVHRSIAVKDVLQSGELAPDRMGVMGYGEYRPVAPNEGRHGNAKNRRVEIYIVPKQAIGDRAIKTTPAKAAPAAPAAEEDTPATEK